MATVQLSEAERFISSLPVADSARIFAHLRTLENGWIGGLNVKTLKGKIRKLVIGQYRIIFFEEKSTIYVVDAFRKKSQRTPLRIIERAQRILRTIKEMKK